MDTHHNNDLARARADYIAAFCADVAAEPEAYKASVQADPEAAARSCIAGLDAFEVRQCIRMLADEAKAIARHRLSFAGR